MDRSVEESLDAQWWRASDESLLAGLVELATMARQLNAAMLRAVAEAQSRDLAKTTGYPSLTVLLRDLLRVTRRDAGLRIEHATALTQGRSVTGAPIPAALPATARAAAAGAIGVEHITAITKTMKDITGFATDEQRGEAERILVDAAEMTDAQTVARLGREIIARLDQDGAPPSESSLANPINELHYTRTTGGRVLFKGELDPEAGALFTTVLSPLAKPHPTGDQPDRRTAAERQGDALVDILRLAADTGELPAEAGERPHVTVTIPLRALKDGIGEAFLGDTAPLTASAARRLACDANIIPMVLGSRSEPLDIGRTSRTVPVAIRRALIHRDRGCAFPHCDRPSRWCHAHHIQHWADGGETMLDNLVLLCGMHHRLIHHTDWRVAIAGGQPEFIPPEYLDRNRTPRQNPLRHVIGAPRCPAALPIPRPRSFAGVAV